MKRLVYSALNLFFFSDMNQFIILIIPLILIMVTSGDDFRLSFGYHGNQRWPNRRSRYYLPESARTDETCVCVPAALCSQRNIVTDGMGLIDARRRECVGRCRRCREYEVCCLSHQRTSKQCGVSQLLGSTIGSLAPPKDGHADFGKWPWQWMVKHATLIDSRHVLTVAHCVKKFTGDNQYPLRIRLGEWDTQHKDEPFPHQDYDVQDIFLHPSFDAISLWNDIAVLRLVHDVTFQPHISPICLPNFEDVFEGENCVVTGWGKDSFQDGRYTNLMREIRVPVIFNALCEELLRNTFLGPYYNLHDGFICAGGVKDEDSCKGDGGGPLSCWRQDGTYSLAGLVGWGVECGKPGLPGVYVRIQKYLSWITSITGKSIESYWSD
ncbi:serine proteinase stubble-like [Limulus polyphemus]|uniref:Serine proteinase stubble-like n=1 Tax=Limulus polyphemus TaxID=6850 RepID=A0ABM1RXZ7_LIMPO|nr:serine proteinase stubble-like [Limulus polyphemus]